MQLCRIQGEKKTKPCETTLKGSTNVPIITKSEVISQQIFKLKHRWSLNYLQYSTNYITMLIVQRAFVLININRRVQQTVHVPA